MKNYRAHTPQNLVLTKILQNFRKTNTPQKCPLRKLSHLDFELSSAGMCLFCRNVAKLYGVPGFWDNVLDSFTCFYIETAYLNCTFSCTYTLSFLARHNFSKTSTPLTPQLRWQFYHWHMLAYTSCTKSKFTVYWPTRTNDLVSLFSGYARIDKWVQQIYLSSNLQLFHY